MKKVRVQISLATFFALICFLLSLAGQVYASGETAACMAAQKGDLAALKKAVEKFKMISCGGSQGGTALDIAVAKGRGDMAEYLANVKNEHGAGLSADSFNKMLNNPQFVPALRVMAKNKDYMHLAPRLVEFGVLKGQPDIAEAAIATGKSSSPQGNLFPQAIAMQCFSKLVQSPGDQNAIKILDFMYSHGADPNFEAKPGQGTMIFQAVQMGDVELVKLLIAKGANVNAKMGGKHTPLSLTQMMLKTQLPPQKKAAFQEIEKMLKAKGAK